METIRERVGAYLEKTGESKSSLAERLGMGRTTLFQKMNGRSEFTLCEAQKLSQILNCSIDDLFVSPFASDEKQSLPV